MKESRTQAQKKAAHAAKQDSRRKQGFCAATSTNVGLKKNLKQSPASSLEGAKSSKRRKLPQKINNPKAACKPSRLKRVPANVKRKRLSQSVDGNESPVKSLITPPRAGMCSPVSCSAHQPEMSVLEALEKLLSSVKALCNQECLLTVLEADIRFSSKSGGCFEPKDGEWSDLQEHLLALQMCLQDLRSSLESRQPEGPHKAAGPVEIETEPEATSCEPAPTSDSARDPVTPVEDPPLLQDEEAEEEEPADPDWLPADSPTESPEPPAAAADAATTAEGERASQEREALERFPCTSGCEEKPGVVRQFASEKSLRMHLAACHGQRAAGRGYPEYTCPQCSSVQKRPRDLAAHITTCQGGGECRARPAPSDAAAGDAVGASFVMCRLCHLCFPTSDLLRRHCCQYADTGGVIQEKIGRDELTVWGAELAQLRRFICHQCQEEFRNQAIYRVHLQFCVPPPYTCELCEVTHTSGRRLVQHKMAQHRELNKPLFFCRAPGCGLSFRLNAALQKHMVQRHSSKGPGQPYGCDVCDKKFIKKIYLTHHKLRYHHETLQRDFVCDVCGARLGSSSALTVHVKSVHARPEYTCDVCGKVFSRQDRLRIHAKIHTGVKPYQCSLCPKAFIQQCKLNDHLRRHRGEKRFRCVMCDKMYAASHDLRSHLRRIHSVDMVNKTHTIQPAGSLLRPLPPPEPQPEPAEPPELPPEPPEQLPPEPAQEPAVQQLPTVVQQPLQSVQLHSVQVAAPAQTLHVQDLSQLARGVILIPAVDASGGTSFYPIINQ